LKLGVKSENIYLLGKHYSTHKESKETIRDLGINLQSNLIQTKLGNFSEAFTCDVKNLWNFVLHDILQKDINALIILDDGGHCLANTPEKLIIKYRIVGIEQTASGLFNPKVLKLPFPLINVACSAAKKWLEPPIISNAIVRKLSSILPLEDGKLCCGVIGFGAIGKAVAFKLSILNNSVVAYDKNHFQNTKDTIISHTKSIEKVILNSDHIFGCTGTDITANVDILKIMNKEKSLISCSSEDIEFRLLLKLIQQNNHSKFKLTFPLSDILYESECDRIIRIYRSGFPINFDNSKEIEYPKEIQLTRGLLLGGILQAISLMPLMKKNRHARLALHSDIQQFIVHRWKENQTGDFRISKFLEYFDDISWIKNHSEAK
jgi:hypothetical protein